MVLVSPPPSPLTSFPFADTLTKYELIAACIPSIVAVSLNPEPFSLRMPHRDKAQLKYLADQIQAIEEGGWSACRNASDHASRVERSEADPCGAVATGWAEVDRVLGGGGGDKTSGRDGRIGSAAISNLPQGLQRGALHEWLGVAEVSPREKGRGAPWTPPLCLLVHLAWQALAYPPLPATCGVRGQVLTPLRENEGGVVVWIGRYCWPHPRVMVRREAGFNGAREAEGRMLLRRSLFADPSGTAARLWAVDLALRSPAVAAVVTDGRGFDMAATRRLQLAAESRRGMALLARPRDELSCLSVAATRWVVAWAGPSAQERKSIREKAASWPEDSDVNGDMPSWLFRPRWILTLQRCRSQRTAVHTEHQWMLEWKRGQLVVVVSSELVD